MTYLAQGIWYEAFDGGGHDWYNNRLTAFQYTTIERIKL